MKHSTAIFSFITPFLFQFSVLAQEQPAEFKGELSFLSLVLGNNSNLSTMADNTKSTNEINSKGNTELSVIPALLGKISYSYGDQLAHQVFLGTSREDVAVGTLALEAGYQYTFDSNTKIAFSYLPTLLKKQVWNDPYAINIERKEIDTNGNAYRLQLKQINQTPVSVDFIYANSDIENDESGRAFGLSNNEQNLLQRSSDNYYAEVSYRQFLGRGLGITPAFSYLISEAKGKSVSYDQFGAKLSYFSFANRNRIVTSLAYQGRSYEAVHPIFLKKRQDHEFSAFLVYEYGDFFDIPSLSFVSINGLSLSNSNIEFYDQNQFVTSLGVTYRF